MLLLTSVSSSCQLLLVVYALIVYLLWCFSIIGMLLGACIAFYIIIGDLSPAIISKLTGLEVRHKFHIVDYDALM